jgi:hypothetical protein
MSQGHSFKFSDQRLNRQLLSLIKKACIKHRVATDGTIHYSSRDDELFENELVERIRSSVFPSWQVLSCPKGWAERYEGYMLKHGVPFREELIDGQVSFLIPRKHRPHTWKLDNARSVVYRSAI